MSDVGGEQPATEGVVRFGLFGGVRVERDGADVEVTQPKQRALLALMLATPGQSVSIVEIIDSVWAGVPAASVVNQVHRHIGALRRICEPGLPRRHAGRYLVSAGSGYRLALTADNSDVLRFRSLVRQAEQLAETDHRHAALRAYLAALQLATTPAGDESLRALPVFVGLEDERVRAIVAAAALCESPEQHAALLPVLRVATGRHPLDETLHTHEITALCRTGRASDALTVYQRIRGALDQELGASPSAALDAAQALALHGDAPHRVAADTRGGAAPPAVVPAQLPSPSPGFTGRRRQLSSLRNHSMAPGRAPDMSRPGSGLVTITGMAGVGKTTLALRYAADAAGDYPDGQLYVNLRGFDATAAPTDPLDALHDLLHGLGIAAGAMPNSLGARSGLLRSVLADRRVLLVLDNARNYRQVETLLPGTGATLVIITSRNTLPGLVAFHQARPVEVEPFDDDEVLEFFTHRLSAGRVDPHRDALLRLGRACGGLPLALAVVAARAEANPRFPLDLFVAEFTGGRARLPALNAGSAEVDLATVFSWSHQGLSPEAARVFAVLSAHPGPDISTAAAMSMSRLDAPQTDAVLAELTQAHVLRPSAPGRQVFHDLLREYALGLLDDRFPEASRRLVNHYVRSTSNALASFEQPPAAATPPETLPGIAAERFTSSADATAWYAAHRHVLRAVCRRAVEMDDYRSALMLMLDWRPMSQAIDTRRDMLPFAELAIHAADHVDDLALRAEAYRDVASNFARTDQLDRARTYFEKATRTYRSAGDQLGLANVYRSMCVTLPMDPTERVRLLGEAVAVVRDLDEGPTLALAMHSLGLGYLWDDQPDAALHAFDEAWTIAASAGNLAHLEPHLLSARSRTLARAGRFGEAAEDARKALNILRLEGATHAELRLLHSHGEVLAALGRRAEAAQAWRRYLSLATGPEHIRETNALDDNADGTATIDRIRTQLAALNEKGPGGLSDDRCNWR